VQAVILLDQRKSRARADLVAEWSNMLNTDPSLAFLLPFERTAGDEMQALVDDPRTLTELALRVLDSAQWWVGIGVGVVSQPLPRSVREGQGQAFHLARRALEAAKRKGSAGLRVLAADRDNGDLEAALLLMGALYRRRSAASRRVIDLVRAGESGLEVAERLGISPQAVSQHLRLGQWREEQAGRVLVTHLAENLLR
jgi:DNA-binding transcriptional ArsR family regulator